MTKDKHLTGHESPAPPLPVIDVITLLGEGKEAILLHNGEPYRLRVTANNKLILTK
jgi:hemin uptake protein HemP